MPVFFKHRTQCVGCYMAKFDTLEDVAANYHLSVDDLLRELKNTLSARPGPTLTFLEVKNSRIWEFF